MFKKHQKIFYTILIILVVLVGTRFLTVGKNKVIDNFFSVITKPVGTIFSTVSWWTHQKLSFFTNIGDLKNQNQKLFDENLTLRSQVAQLEEIKNENNIFREQLKLAPREKYNLLPALIIGRESGGYSEVIYLNKGKEDGLRDNMAILVGKGILVGRITEVDNYTAKARLVTDKESRINAQLLNKNGSGLIKGEFGTSMIMTMIPQTVKLEKGDTVVTSNLSNYFPEGLLIGYIEEVTGSNDQLFQQATISSPVDFDNLHLVWVLLN